MKIENHDHNTYVLGTIEEVCSVIGKAIERNDRMGKCFEFPRFYFSTITPFDMSSHRPARDIALCTGEWYGCELVKTSFDSDHTVTICADYCGGGAASAGSIWLDELKEEDVKSVISSVVRKSLEMNETITDETLIIIETEQILPIYTDEELPQLRTKYEKFKIQWMIDHGYTLSALIASLASALEDSEEPLVETYNIWERDAGFGGEIWPCFDEWLDCEYKEEKK